MPAPLQGGTARSVSPRSVAALSRAAAEVRAFRASRMVDVCRFVAATQTALEENGAVPPGAGQEAAAAAAGWPVARWEAMAEAAGIYEQLVGMGLELSSWKTDEQVRLPACLPACLPGHVLSKHGRDFCLGLAGSAGQVCYTRLPRLRTSPEDN